MSERKIFQVEAPIDLVCAVCHEVGVTIRVVFPLDYAITHDGIQFESPDVAVPVQLACNHCGEYVNYGPVGKFGEGTLSSHGEQGTEGQH